MHKYLNALVDINLISAVIQIVEENKAELRI
jgi:hypothetical protein